MQSHSRAALLVVGLIFLAAVYVAVGDDNQQVGGKPKSVTKNDAIDYNDEEATGPQSVTSQGIPLAPERIDGYLRRNLGMPT